MLIQDSPSVAVGRPENPKGLIIECLDFLRIKKGMNGFFSLYCGCVHIQDTFIREHHIKVNFASNDVYYITAVKKQNKTKKQNTGGYF